YQSSIYNYLNKDKNKEISSGEFKYNGMVTYGSTIQYTPELIRFRTKAFGTFEEALFNEMIKSKYQQK
ncbi:MAG: hypothetical protein IT221_06795, partial [Fluviicola sp.]|nr:hypothetical protein [Fluviicola sp.]